MDRVIVRVEAKGHPAELVGQAQKETCDEGQCWRR
jgi:hypothetical protein